MNDIYKSEVYRRHTKDRGTNVTTRWMAVAEDLFAENVRLKAESKRHHDQFCAETLRTSELRKEIAALREQLTGATNMLRFLRQNGGVVSDDALNVFDNALKS